MLKTIYCLIGLGSGLFHSGRFIVTTANGLDDIPRLLPFAVVVFSVTAVVWPITVPIWVKLALSWAH